MAKSRFGIETALESCVSPALWVENASFTVSDAWGLRIEAVRVAVSSLTIACERGLKGPGVRQSGPPIFGHPREIFQIKRCGAFRLKRARHHPIEHDEMQLLRLISGPETNVLS